MLSPPGTGTVTTATGGTVATGRTAATVAAVGSAPTAATPSALLASGEPPRLWTHRSQKVGVHSTLADCSIACGQLPWSLACPTFVDPSKLRNSLF